MEQHKHSANRQRAPLTNVRAAPPAAICIFFWIECANPQGDRATVHGPTTCYRRCRTALPRPRRCGRPPRRGLSASLSVAARNPRSRLRLGALALGTLALGTLALGGVVIFVGASIGAGSGGVAGTLALGRGFGVGFGADGGGCSFAEAALGARGLGLGCITVFAEAARGARGLAPAAGGARGLGPGGSRCRDGDGGSSANGELAASASAAREARGLGADGGGRCHGGCGSATAASGTGLRQGRGRPLADRFIVRRPARLGDPAWRHCLRRGRPQSPEAEPPLEVRLSRSGYGICTPSAATLKLELDRTPTPDAPWPPPAPDHLWPSPTPAADPRSPLLRGWRAVPLAPPCWCQSVCEPSGELGQTCTRRAQSSEPRVRSLGPPVPRARNPESGAQSPEPWALGLGLGPRPLRSPEPRVRSPESGALGLGLGLGPRPLRSPESGTQSPEHGLFKV